MGELFQTGLTITAVGMGVVFVLLTMLVGIIQAMSALAARLTPETPATATATQVSPAAGDAETIAVIAAAIGAYRARHRPPGN